MLVYQRVPPISAETPVGFLELEDEHCRPSARSKDVQGTSSENIALTLPKKTPGKRNPRLIRHHVDHNPDGGT